nr:uncharacterized protein LOC124490145 [Dermatophagoides farinae]
MMMMILALLLIILSLWTVTIIDCTVVDVATLSNDVITEIATINDDSITCVNRFLFFILVIGDIASIMTISYLVFDCIRYLRKSKTRLSKKPYDNVNKSLSPFKQALEKRFGSIKSKLTPKAAAAAAAAAAKRLKQNHQSQKQQQQQQQQQRHQQ